jgi:hypothetical protein
MESHFAPLHDRVMSLSFSYSHSFNFSAVLTGIFGTIHTHRKSPAVRAICQNAAILPVLRITATDISRERKTKSRGSCFMDARAGATQTTPFSHYAADRDERCFLPGFRKKQWFVRRIF